MELQNFSKGNNKKEPTSLLESFKSLFTIRNTASWYSFFLTLTLLSSIAAFGPKKPVLLILDRFIPGLGWIEVVLLSVYALIVTENILDPKKTAIWRKRIWLLFSFIFFSQLTLGIIGYKIFLMTGELHFPIPALIFAGPLYRGEGIFMPILFFTTVALIGPAWCSYICYFGSWDNKIAMGKKRSTILPAWRQPLRITLTVIFFGGAYLMRLAGVPLTAAIVVAIVFVLIGVGIIMFLSRKTGTMVHCVTYCPIGLAATVFGRINPFRIKINDDCTNCMKCTVICRYDSLSKKDIMNRQPNLSCTLCGDCMGVCESNALEYRFLKMKPENARILFFVLTISLHSVVLGLARI